jgi:hypothetical protein
MNKPLLFPKPDYKEFNYTDVSLPDPYRVGKDKNFIDEFDRSALLQVLEEAWQQDDAEAILTVWSSVLDKQDPSFPGVQLAKVEISMPPEVSSPFPLSDIQWIVLGVIITTQKQTICTLSYNSASDTTEFNIFNSFSKEDYIDYDNDVVWNWRKEQMEAWLDTNVGFCFRLVYADNPLIDS